MVVIEGSTLAVQSWYKKWYEKNALGLGRERLVLFLPHPLYPWHKLTLYWNFRPEDRFRLKEWLINCMRSLPFRSRSLNSMTSRCLREITSYVKWTLKGNFYSPTALEVQTVLPLSKAPSRKNGEFYSISDFLKKKFLRFTFPHTWSPIAGGYVALHWLKSLDGL